MIIDPYSRLRRGTWGRARRSVPERVFSILNDTFDDDMGRAHADYIELSLQLQFNSRAGGGADGP